MKNDELSFEQSMERLEQIVKLLEKGDAPLDGALSLFEEGTRLAARCGVMLDRAEKKIVRLVKGEDGTPGEESFGADI